MPRFFISPDDVKGNRIILTGDDALHVSRSLRMRPGEKLTVCDGMGTDYLCRTENFSSSDVTLCVEHSEPSRGEPPYAITVYQALVKGDKFDTVVQKSVECGADRIVPFYSRNCVVKPSDGEEHRRERRERIAASAAMQSGRGRIPAVGECIDFDTMLSDAALRGPVLFCYEGEGTRPVRELLSALAAKRETFDGISVVVGPEGGFTTDEAERALRAGHLMAGLGPRILRTETAAGFALACIYFAFEE